MTTWTRGVAALSVAAALVATSAPAAVAAPAALRRCAPQSEEDRTRCGRVVVPLDRSGAVPGEIALRVRLAEPRVGRARGTVFALVGGPGQAATPLIDAIAETLWAPLRTRRLVTFDQRGTGRSGRLTCPSLSQLNALSQLDPAVAACATRLGAARTAYTSAASVDDIEAVRAALEIDEIVLYGVSYGTKVALDYAARYPQHVSKLVLDSVVPPGGVDPFMRTTLGSIRRVLNTLCAPRACRFTRDPAADVATLVERVARDGRLHGRAYDERGRPHTVSIGREALFGLLLEGDFDQALRAAFPAAVRAAIDGDIAPLARIASGGPTGLDASQDSEALNLATVCEDGGVPWPAGTPVAQRGTAIDAALAAVPAAALLPFDGETLRLNGSLGYCRAWPESPIAQPTAPLPDVPTLILSGDDDLRTPRKDALTLAARMPSARVVTVRATGHSVLGSALERCARNQTQRFLAGKRVSDCGGRRFEIYQPKALPPARLADVPSAPGLSPRLGRAATAAALTLNDLIDQQVSRWVSAPESGGDEARLSFGGLRGGYARERDDGFLEVQRYSYVPGITLTSVPPRRLLDQPFVLRVGGRAGVRGTIQIGSRGISGRFGGRRVWLDRYPSASARAATSDGADAPSLSDAVAKLRAALADPRSALPPRPLLPAAPGGPPIAR